MTGAANVLVFVFLVSFAIDRIVTGGMFLLSFAKPWSKFVPEPSFIKNAEERKKAERTQKAAYVLLAASLAVIVLWRYHSDLSVLSHLGFETDYALDLLLTGLILVAGSDFLGRLLEMTGAYDGKESANRPVEVEISGTLRLEPPSSGKAARSGEVS